MRSRQELRLFFRKRKRKAPTSSRPELVANHHYRTDQIKLAPRDIHKKCDSARMRLVLVVLLLGCLALGRSEAELATKESSPTTRARDLSTPANNTKQEAGARVLPTTTSTARWKRAAQSAELMRVVAVSGQWIELQCPLVSELMPQQQQQQPNQIQQQQQQQQQQLYSIQWRKNGVRLDQLNPRYKINLANGSLVIANSQPKVDEANYECWLIHAKDEIHGSAAADEQQQQQQPIKSHRLELRLLVPPRVAPFEFPADAQVGMKLVLTCSVLEGQQPISFVWLKDNKIIGDEQRPLAASAPANSLGQLHQQQLADKYALSPIPYSLGRSNYKTEYLLANSSSVASQQQQQEQSAADQQTALLPLLSDSNIRIRQSDDYSILSIDKLELKHSGRYTCSVQNEAARTSHSSQLLINAPPTLTIAPKDADLVSGQSALIECAASGQPRPSISWLRARETDLSSSKQWDYVPLYDNLRYTTLANGSLAIANITQREQGFYLCSAKNPFGTEMSKLAKISVHEPAKFTVKYKTVEVRFEESASLLCVASGELPLTIEWRNKDDILIEPNDKRFIIDREPQADLKQQQQQQQHHDLINATVSRLILAKSKRSDSGHYSCHARNKFGSDKMVTNLLVQDVPDKVTDLKVTNTTSSSIFLRWQLAFNGNSPVTSYLVQYQSDDPLDDLLLSMDTNNQQQQQQQQHQRSMGNHLESGLDGAVVAAAAAASTSAASSVSPLKVALEALNVAESSLDSVVEKAIDRTLIELTVEQSASHLLVKDLSPFCVYRIRLAAINKIGLGEFSDWIRAKTEEAPPGGSASKIVAAATGPNSIKVTWSPPDRRAWNGQLIGFNIGYRPMDSTFELNKTVEWSPPTLQSMVLDARNKHQLAKSSNNTNDQAEQTKQTNGGGGDKSAANHSLRQHLRQLLALQQQELVAHLTNLQRSTTYLLWIQAINSRGYGPQSHAVSVKTLDDVPPSAPAIKIQATSASSITIAWSMLSNFVSSANQYSLFYRKVPSASGPASNRQQANNNNNNNTTDGFSAANDQTQLDFIQHNNQLADLSQSQTFIERSITSQQLMASGNMNLLLEPSMHNNGAATTNQNHLLQQGQQHYHQFVYTLDQLDCGTVYELYMSTRNSVGKSEPSALVSTRTLGEPPMAPINKNNFFSKIGVNEVALNLAAWSTGGCPVTHMTVRYKQSPMPVASASTQNGSQHAANSSSLNAPSMSVSWPITTSVPVSLLNALNNHQLSSRGHYQTQNDLHLKMSESPVYYLKNLVPSNCYELEVIAYNTAGHTSAQYEFVTSNMNGTRAGYSRREGVYRVEQGGELLASDGSARASIEQQMSYKQTTSAQILPLLLMTLCFVCLIISSVFCYNRLAGSWKQRRHRRNSNDTSTTRNHGVTNSSPGSIGGKSSMWGVGDTASRYGALPVSARTAQADASGEPLDIGHRIGCESPSGTMHFCMREPLGANQATFSATLNPKSMSTSSSFGQSVSMKDFNLPNGTKLPAGTATLSYKNYRTTLRHPLDYKTATLRARLLGEQPNGQTFLSQPTNQDNYVELARNGTLVEPNASQVAPAADPYSTHQFNYTQDNHQLQQETSWTNHYHTQCVDQQQQRINGTAYAVPTTATNNYANEQPNNTYGYRQDQNQTIDEHNNQTSIDACIQQLIGQQYQQQQQQQQHQPYSMVMNYKPDRCLYDTAKAANQMVDPSQSSILKSQQQQNVACPAPFMDSSSSSSGIDVGHHLECASTTTGTSNSNTSNEVYNQQQQQQQQQNNNVSTSRLNNGSEFSSSGEQYSLQNVMQQFNEPA